MSVRRWPALDGLRGFAILFVLAARQYVAIKDYSSLAYTKIQRRRLGPVKRWLAVGLVALATCRAPGR